MARLAVEGQRSVYYEVHGQGPTTMVLIHGWGMNSRAWDGVLLPLMDAGVRVVTLDHRGCGRSDHDFDDLSINSIAADVVRITKELSLDSVILNGWSLGGAVATKAAHLMGAKCRGLVLTAGASPIYTQKPDLPLGGLATDVEATVSAMNADRINFLTGLTQAVCAKPVSEAVLNWMAESFIQSSARASVTLGELAHLDQRDLLVELDIPILSYICGKDGFVSPEISQWVADNHPRGRGIVFPESGHAPFIEEREEYLNTLIDFINQI